MALSLLPSLALEVGGVDQGAQRRRMCPEKVVTVKRQPPAPDSAQAALPNNVPVLPDSARAALPYNVLVLPDSAQAVLPNNILVLSDDTYNSSISDFVEEGSCQPPDLPAGPAQPQAPAHPPGAGPSVALVDVCWPHACPGALCPQTPCGQPAGRAEARSPRPPGGGTDGAAGGQSLHPPCPGPETVPSPVRAGQGQDPLGHSGPQFPCRCPPLGELRVRA